MAPVLKGSLELPAQKPVPPQGVLVEERRFDVSFHRNKELLEAAIENATGVELEEIEDGTWTGKRTAGFRGTIHVNASARADDDGTVVELRFHHEARLIAFPVLCLAILLLVTVPLGIWWVASGIKLHERQRVAAMEEAWLEITRALNAPKRSTYRGQPARVYVPSVRIEQDDDEGAADEEAAEQEAAEAEAAELEAAELEAAELADEST